jgi:hypothetical protein
LLEKGWTFQERILSPRVLHFAKDQVLWECYCHLASESCPTKDRRLLDGHFSPHIGEVKRIVGKELFAAEPKPSDWLWYGLLKDYSRCQLTYDSDKLIALSGLAKIVARTSMPQDYLAGLWRTSLPISLMWFTNSGVRLGEYHAPTWSWASIDGQITLSRYRNLDAVAELILASTTTEGDPFGPVTGAFPLIRGSLCQVSLHRSNVVVDNVERIILLVNYFAGVKFWLDDSLNKCRQLDAKSIFFLPVACYCPSPVVQGRSRGLSYEFVGNHMEDACGLLLEPIPDLKGCFGVIGLCTLGIYPSKYEGSTKNLYPGVPFPDPYVLVQKAHATATIEQQFYQDFDGVDKYTIKIL